MHDVFAAVGADAGVDGKVYSHETGIVVSSGPEKKILPRDMGSASTRRWAAPAPCPDTETALALSACRTMPRACAIAAFGLIMWAALPRSPGATGK